MNKILSHRRQPNGCSALRDNIFQKSFFPPGIFAIPINFSVQLSVINWASDFTFLTWQICFNVTADPTSTWAFECLLYDSCQYHRLKPYLRKEMEIRDGHECGAWVKLWEFKKHLVATLGHLGCFSVSIDGNSNLLKCPLNDLPSHSERRNSVFMLLSFSFFPTIPQTDWRTDSFQSLLLPWKRVNYYRTIQKGEGKDSVSFLLMKAIIAKTKAKINNPSWREWLQRSTSSNCISTG